MDFGSVSIVKVFRPTRARLLAPLPGLMFGLLLGHTACQQSAFDLTPELEATCSASMEANEVPPESVDREIVLGTVPEGAQEQCYVATWPIGESTFVTGFRTRTDTVLPLLRAEVFEIRAEEGISDLPGLLANEPTGFECPGVMHDTRLAWWFQTSGTSWVNPEAGARRVSGSTRLLVRLVFDGPVTAETSVSTDWTVTSNPTRLAETTAVFDPFWLLKGGFDLPAGVDSVSRVFTLDLATRLGVDSMAIRETRIETGKASVQTLLAIERPSGDRACIDLRTGTDASSLRSQTLMDPVTLQKGDKLQISCRWNTANKASASTWSKTDECCRAVVVYTREEAQ